MTNLCHLLQEVGIMNGDGILVQGNRLFACDEKGLSQRADSLASGVVARHQTRRATAATANVTREHLTLTSFVSVSDRRYPVGCVVPTKTVHPDMQKMFPRSVIYPNPSGSTTAAIFSEFVLQCMLLPAREHIASGQALVLVLDSGGGQWLHLSPRLLQLCLKHNCRLFYLPAYTTRALCPLDMNIHSEMARLWAAFKAAWAHKQQPLTLFVALRAASEVCDSSLQPGVVRASWAQIGIRAGEGYDREVIFVQRCSSLPRDVSRFSINECMFLFGKHETFNHSLFRVFFQERRA